MYTKGQYKPGTLLIILILLLTAGCLDVPKESPVVRRGVIDLRGWDFEKDGSVQLSGKWEYYHNHTLFDKDFISAAKSLKPEFSSIPTAFGEDEIKKPRQDFGTFRLRILLDKPIDTATLVFQQLLSAYKVYVNGNQIDMYCTSGKLKQGRALVVNKWISDIGAVVDSESFSNNDSDDFVLSIIIHMSYASEVGLNISRPVYLGTRADLQPTFIRQATVDIIISTFLFTISLYSLVFNYLLKNDRMPFYFGLFCIVMGVRSVLTRSHISYLVYDFDIFLLYKTLVICIYLALPLLCMYIHSLFSREFSKVAVRISQWTGGVCAALMLFLPFKLAYKAMVPFEVIGLMTLLYIFYVLARAYENKREGAVIVIISFVVLLITAINDVLFERHIVNTNFYLSYAMVIFVLNQAIFISKKFAYAFVVVESQGRELEASNQQLQQGIDQRIQAEKSLKKSERKYRSILDTIREGYYEIDLKGQVKYFNNSLVTMFGYPQAELMKMNYKDFMSEVEYTEARRVFKEVAQTGRPSFSYKWVVMVRGGIIKWLEVSILLKKDEDAQPVGFFGICRDITERKKKEKAEREMEIEKEANQKIMSSIRYAKMIQTSILPDMEVMKQTIDDFFIIWRPKDIVSGDFYFFEKLDDGFIISISDCTGHGVPGGFMTMIADSGFKRIIANEEDLNPGSILKHLNLIIKTTLGKPLLPQKSIGRTRWAGADDGLDASLVRVDMKNKKLLFAGANSPVFILNKDGCTIIRGDRQSIGFRKSDPDFEFTTHSLELDPDTSYYIFSDGFLDQIGGPKHKMFGRKKLAAILVKIWQLPFEEQKQVIETEFNEHCKDVEIKDDITFFGFRVGI